VLPPLRTFLELVLWNNFQCRLHTFMDVFTVLKSSSLGGRIYFWKQPEVNQSQFRGMGWMLLFSNGLLDQKLLESQSTVVGPSLAKHFSWPNRHLKFCVSVSVSKFVAKPLLWYLNVYFEAQTSALFNIFIGSVRSFTSASFTFSRPSLNCLCYSKKKKREKT
jgi:hypothetical protein